MEEKRTTFERKAIVICSFQGLIDDRRRHMSTWESDLIGIFSDQFLSASRPRRFVIFSEKYSA